MAGVSLYKVDRHAKADTVKTEDESEPKWFRHRRYRPETSRPEKVSNLLFDHVCVRGYRFQTLDMRRLFYHRLCGHRTFQIPFKYLSF